MTKFKKITGAVSALILALCIGYYGATHWYGVTPYYSADKEAVMKILQDDWYWLVAEGSFDFVPEYTLTHRAASNTHPDNSLQIFVYRVHNKPVGFVTYYKEQGCRGLIQFLAVAKEYRGHGYAQKLLNYAVHHAMQHGICMFNLVTRTTNIPAQKLYQRLGFEKIWEEDGFVAFQKSLLPGYSAQ